MPVGVLVVFACASARLTGLVVADEITRPARDAILRRLDEGRPTHRALAYLISCWWCAGLWTSAAVAPLAYWHSTNPWVFVPALALAFSWFVGTTSSLGRGE